jgi:tetratricopeptide (TPR) repeat protein
MLVAAIGAVIVPLRSAHAKSSRLSIAILILVPAIAAGFYAGLGTPSAATRNPAHQFQRYAAVDPAAEGRPGKTVGSVASMLDGLKSRLENEPDDAGGWLLLAKSYRHLGQTAEAAAAYERAKKLGMTDASFEQSTTSVAPVPEAAAPNTGPVLRGRVSLSADAALLVEPDDTVFIFAKESADHRMPIVALRKPASDLPIQFELTDRDTLVAGTSLAQFDHLVISAKVSRSGLATDVLAGLETWSDAVSPLDGHAIELQLTTNPRAEAVSPGDPNE